MPMVRHHTAGVCAAFVVQNAEVSRFILRSCETLRSAVGKKLHVHLVGFRCSRFVAAPIRDFRLHQQAIEHASNIFSPLVSCQMSAPTFTKALATEMV